MSQKIRFTGNSRAYGIDIDGERLQFSEINVGSDISSVATNISLSGGNLVIEIPEGVDWKISSDNKVAYLTTDN